MGRLTNTNGKRIGYLTFDLSDSETSQTIVLRVIPAAGYILKASPVDVDVEIQARESGVGSFADIATAPIDLSGYPENVPVDFEFKAIAGSPLVDVRRVAISLSVSSSGAAAW